MRIRGARLRGGRAAAAEAGPTFTDWAPACEAIDSPEEEDGLGRDGEWDDEADRDGDGGRNSSAIPGATLTGKGAAAAAAAAGFISDVLRDGGSDPANAVAPTIGPAAAAPDEGIIPNSTPTEPTGAGAAAAGCAGPTPPPAAAAGKDSARRNALPSSKVATAKASAPQ